MLLTSDPITSTRNPALTPPAGWGAHHTAQHRARWGGCQFACRPSLQAEWQAEPGPAQPWGHHQCWAPRMTGYSSTGALGPFPARSPLPHPEPWSHGAWSSLTVSCFKVDSGHFLKCLWNLKNDMSRCVLAFCHFVCLKNVRFAGSLFVV